MTIAARQFRSYFNTPVAYIVMFLVLLVLGFLFFFWPPGFFLADRASVSQMFFFFGILMGLAAPALTMGLIAEERGSGTIELLLTMPVRESEVIIGKYLGALGLFSVMVALTLPIPIGVSTLGDLDWGPVIGGYVGLFLQGAAMLSLGIMVSSWTKDQLVAFFISFFLLVIVLWAAPLALGWAASGSMATFMQSISIQERLASMTRGVIDTRDVIYFLSLTALGLLVAFRALESRRWS
ncbi:MAG TPA: ABC transporter permease [Sandaracinaceae bacterium LLY-WYZ-13_1]|nr:ABC transporter permease [Sandaracinaceae bacterium LLY-WYZ-13_1]